MVHIESHYYASLMCLHTQPDVSDQQAIRCQHTGQINHVNDVVKVFNYPPVQNTTRENCL